MSGAKLKVNEIDSSGDPPAVERIRVADSMPILLTKLHRPWVAPGFELRARLLERLDSNSHRALTLISAPAGYGKTALASMWLQASDCASVWVSLDERDDDLVTFTAYLLAACKPCRAQRDHALTVVT